MPDSAHEKFVLRENPMRARFESGFQKHKISNSPDVAVETALVHGVGYAPARWFLKEMLFEGDISSVTARVRLGAREH